MEGEFVEMGKLIGAGLACSGMGGAAVGVGHVVGNFLSGALRNPNAAAGQTATMCGSYLGNIIDNEREALNYLGTQIVIDFYLFTSLLTLEDFLFCFINFTFLHSLILGNLPPYK